MIVGETIAINTVTPCGLSWWSWSTLHDIQRKQNPINFHELTDELSSKFANSNRNSK